MQQRSVVEARLRVSRFQFRHPAQGGGGAADAPQPDKGRAAHLIHQNLVGLRQAADVQLVQCRHALPVLAARVVRLPQSNLASHIAGLQLEVLLEGRHRLLGLAAPEQRLGQHPIPLLQGLLVGPLLDELLELRDRLGVVAGLERDDSRFPSGGRGGSSEQYTGRREGKNRSVTGHSRASVRGRQVTPGCLTGKLTVGSDGNERPTRRKRLGRKLSSAY